MDDAIDDAWDGVAARVALGELPTEPDVAAALDGAGALRDPRALERVQAALDRFWELVHHAPGRALGLATVAAVVADHGAAPAPLRSELRRQQATALFALGRARDSAAAVEAALSALGSDPGPDADEAARTRAALLGFLGNARLALGQVTPALVALEEAIALARARGLRRAMGTYLSSLGNARFFAGEARAAAGYYEDALAIAREEGSREGEAVNLNNLGLARQALGDLDGALERYQDALSIARQLGDRRSAGAIEANIAQALFEQGDLEGAQRHHEVAIELARSAEDRGTEAVALLRMAALLRERGALSEAQARVEEADALLGAIDDPRRSGAWVEAARLRLDGADDPAGARALLERALDAARAVGDRRTELAALRELGRVERRARRQDAAHERLTEALDLARDLEDPDLVAWTRIDLADLCAEVGHPTDARRHLDRAAERVAEREGSLLEAHAALARAALAAATGERARARAALDDLARSARAAGFVAVQREATRRLAAMSCAGG